MNDPRGRRRIGRISAIRRQARLYGRRQGQPPPIQPPEPPASERLESWKEIANYLKRGVRTIQRWEKQEGLPVHRHLHDKLGTVYAYQPEIDAWWENGRSRLEQQEQVRASSRRPLWWAVAAAVVVVAAAGVGLWLWLGQQPALPFEERDWVLIASFENRTGEEVFDGTLEYALERELSNSRFVNVVPRQRINDTLRLMRRSLDTALTPAVAREVALRDGGIRALLTGRVEKLDTTYLLSATLVDAVSGVTVASFSAEAEGQKQVVPAVRRLSNRVRNTLGEKLSSIQESEQKLEKVTTPSLRALQLYSQADALIRQEEGQAPAEELLKQAVTEDPEFASGYMHLAWAIRNQGKPESEWRPHSERALELSKTTTERERYFIRGSYYQQIGEDEKAIAPYQALLRLYPDHYWGTGNLASLYAELGRQEEASALRVNFADLRPNDFTAQVGAAMTLAIENENVLQAQPYLQRAKTLASLVDAQSTAAFWPVWLQLFPAYEHWLRGDLARVQRELTLAERTFDSQAWDQTYAIQNLGSFYLTLGKLTTAKHWFQRYPDPSWRSMHLAFVAFARDDTQTLREHIAVTDMSLRSATLVILCVRAGLLSTAEKRLANIPSSWQGYAALRGELALARGQTTEAIELLQEGIRRMQGGAPSPPFFLAAESLAKVHERQGDSRSALQVLEAAAREKARIYGRLGPVGLFWMRTQFQLAQLYRKVGREQKAAEIETELRKLLAYADPDYPLLLQLQRTQKSTAVQLRN